MDLLLREQFSKLVNTIPPWSSKDSFNMNGGSEPYMFNEYSDIINNAEYNIGKTTFKFSFVKGQLLNYFRYSFNSGEPDYYITKLNKPTENYDTTKDDINDLFTIHRSYDFENWDFNMGKSVAPVIDQFKIEFNLLKVDIDRSHYNSQTKYSNTDTLKQVYDEYYSTSINSISFGPLLIKENDKVSTDVDFFGNSITIPEIQMIAVISNKVPFSPIEVVTSTPQPTNQNQNLNPTHYLQIHIF
ncbi:hypothetical protein ACTFIZ_003554 [Dictyostelium cf. discoideum]